MNQPDPASAAILQLLSRLELARVDFRLLPLEAYVPNGAHASDVRGALGKALYGTPDYAALFEEELPTDGRPLRGLAGGQGAPRSWLCRVRPEGELRAGQPLDVALTLLRADRVALRKWIGAMLLAAENGLGRGTVPFVLDAIEVHPPTNLAELVLDRWRSVSEGSNPTGIDVRLLTPARLLSGGERLPATPPVLADALLRRLDALVRLHGEGPEELDRRPFTAAAAELMDDPRFLSELTWERSWRYSKRQDREVPLGGCVGRWRASVPDWLGLLLAAGELVHVGKGTTQGLGALQIEASAR